MYTSLYQLRCVERLTVVVLVSSLADENITQIRIPLNLISDLHSFLDKTFYENILRKLDARPDFWHPVTDPYPISKLESITDGALLGM